MHDHTTTDRLLARLEHVESELAAVRRSARRSGFLLATLTIGLAAAVLGAAAAPDVFNVVRTKRLEIVDGQDKIVALLANGAEGGQLDIWNGSGANAARVAGTVHGGDVSIWNSLGKPAVGTFATDAGGRFEVYDSAGNPQGRISGTRDGGSLALLSTLGKPGVIASATDRGGALSACDSIGRPLAELAISESAGLIRVGDKSAHQIAALRASPRGGLLELADNDGKTNVSAGADVGGGSITLLSTEGSPMVTAGATPESGGSLEVRNGQGKAVVRNFAGEDGAGRFVVASADGQPSVGAQGATTGGIFALLFGGQRVAIIEANSAGGRFELTDAAGQSAVAIGVDGSSRTGALSLRNEKAQEVLRAGGDERGSGAVTVYNRDGKDRKVFSVK